MSVERMFIALVGSSMVWVGAAPSLAASSVGVIGITSETTAWCNLLTGAGFACTAFPATGPTQPLSDFDVIVDLSEGWADPGGELAPFIQSGKGVLTWGQVPAALGLMTNSVVRDWIGANAHGDGQGSLVTTVADPLLGARPAGTQIGHCPFDLCASLMDTTGHPKARILAWNNDHNQQAIGILRNTFGHGRSIYLEQIIIPTGSQFPDLGEQATNDEIIVNAVQELAIGPIVPAVSSWGIVVMALLLVTAGTLVRFNRAAPHPGTRR